MLPHSLVYRFIGVLALSALVVAAPPGLTGTEWFVASGASGSGSAASPFGRIQDALNVAQPGDTITVRPGTYRESLRTVRHGTSSSRITLRSSEGDAALVTSSGRVLTIAHAFYTIEDLVFDGDYGTSDAIQIATAADGFVLRHLEVRRSSRDLIDIGGPAGGLIEGCTIHHALNAAGGRTDAHGIVAGAVQGLTVRDTEIHTFSGDGFQIDPARAAPGWRDVTLDGLRIWLEPLPSDENGFAAGTVPGENAVDTKSPPLLARASLTIRNTIASGFRNGLITNMAAFNLKEHVEATLDGVSVFDSEIAFRLRGNRTMNAGAWVTIKNAVVYDVETAYRYEDRIQNLRILNNTVGRGIERVFQAAVSTAEGIEVANMLVLGTLPKEAAAASNLGVGEREFVDVGSHDYQLRPNALAIDAGVTLAEVTVDRNGIGRPAGRAYDIGAFEFRPR
jgi:hypothetical protein